MKMLIITAIVVFTIEAVIIVLMCEKRQDRVEFIDNNGMQTKCYGGEIDSVIKGEVK